MVEVVGTNGDEDVDAVGTELERFRLGNGFN